MKSFNASALLVVLVLGLSVCWQSEANARGGCSACAGGQCQAEAPVVTATPDQSVCTSGCHPVANAAAGAVRETAAVVRRVASDGPVRRWVRARRGGCQ